MSYVFDLSYGWPTITGAKIKAAGATGVIGYAGCKDPGKNVSRARLEDWLTSGLQVGLVIENNAADALGGAAVGTQQGNAVVAAARVLGYDYRNCVLFGGYDTDAHQGDYSKLLAYMKAFAKVVPVPGYYGDSDSIDYLHNHGGSGWIFWQSSSASFSPKNPTLNAHLHQQFADHRAHGLDVDVNDVLRTPLQMMGEDPMPTLDEIRGVVRTEIANAKADYAQASSLDLLDGRAVNVGGKSVTIRNALRQLLANSNPAAVAKEIVAALPAGTNVTQAQIEAALKSVFADAAS